MKGNYPKDFFALHLAMGFLSKIYLLTPGITLLIVGIWLRPCIYIGVAFILLAFVLALYRALATKKTFETPSDHPEFQRIQNEVMSGNWREGMQSVTQEEPRGEAGQEKGEE